MPGWDDFNAAATSDPVNKNIQSTPTAPVATVTAPTGSWDDFNAAAVPPKPAGTDLFNGTAHYTPNLSALPKTAPPVSLPKVQTSTPAVSKNTSTFQPIVDAYKHSQTLMPQAKVQATAASLPKDNWLSSTLAKVGPAIGNVYSKLTAPKSDPNALRFNYTGDTLKQNPVQKQTGYQVTQNVADAQKTKDNVDKAMLLSMIPAAMVYPLLLARGLASYYVGEKTISNVVNNLQGGDINSDKHISDLLGITDPNIKTKMDLAEGLLAAGGVDHVLKGHVNEGVNMQDILDVKPNNPQLPAGKETLALPPGKVAKAGPSYGTIPLSDGKPEPLLLSEKASAPDRTKGDGFTMTTPSKNDLTLAKVTSRYNKAVADFGKNATEFNKQRVLSARDDVTKYTKIKNQETGIVTNSKDPKITYKPNQDLGDKMATVIHDAKTGKSQVLIDKSVNTPEKVADVIDNAHEKIIQSRTDSNPQSSVTPITHDSLIADNAANLQKKIESIPPPEESKIGSAEGAQDIKDSNITGEKSSVPKLASDLNDSLPKEMQSPLEGTPNMNKQLAEDKASSFYEKNPDLGYEIAMGRAEAPEGSGFYPENMFTVLANKAADESDHATTADLLRSKIAPGSKVMGQRIASLDRGNGDDPMKVAQQIRSIMEENTGGSKKAQAVRDNVVKTITNEISKINLSKKDLSWDNFLDSIKC